MMKIISCEIFKPYIELLNMELDIVYLDIEGHNYPKRLARMIQKEIDQSINYEKILVLYGLCGNALLDLEARDIPIYVIRVHDCLSILLGSKERFYHLFKERLSCGWSCYSLENRVISYDGYDKEEVEYLKSVLDLKKDVYVSFSLEKEKDYEKKYTEIIIGNLQFLKSIISLESTELLQVAQNDILKFDEKEIVRKR